MSRNRSANLFDLIVARAPHPDKLALETRDTTALTYGELFKRSARAANALDKARAIGREDVRYFAGGMNAWRMDARLSGGEPREPST